MVYGGGYPHKNFKLERQNYKNRRKIRQNFLKRKKMAKKFFYPPTIPHRKNFQNYTPTVQPDPAHLCCTVLLLLEALRGDYL